MKPKRRKSFDSQTIIDRHGLPGVSQSLAETLRLAEFYADVEKPVMIFTELGCDNEIKKIAEILHGKRTGGLSRHDCRIYKNDAGAFHRDLFGNHQQSALLADCSLNGTLFLENVDELNSEAQSALRAFHDDVERREIKIRIVTTANENLEQRVERNEYNLSLFYRLRLSRITLEPLRRRPEDIESLVQYYRKKIEVENNQTIAKLRSDTLAILKSCKWAPFNHLMVDQAVFHLCVMTEDEWVTPDNISAKMLREWNGGSYAIPM